MVEARVHVVQYNKLNEFMSSTEFVKLPRVQKNRYYARAHLLLDLIENGGLILDDNEMEFRK